jgi:hypothetical protein
MAIRSRQRTTISTPSIISDRCAPNRQQDGRVNVGANPATKQACCALPFR